MSPPDLYYDPYDFEIDTDPYPIWRRLRDEAPLYYNEKYDFYAVSRFDDCEKALVDWRTYSSARGTLLELIKANIDMPPGSIIFEDPPAHDVHRGLLSRVFTPRRVNGLEPKIREFCAHPARSARRFRAGSTSSTTSVPTCRCARSACSSASPRRTRRRCGRRSTRGCGSSRARCPTRSSGWRTPRRRRSVFEEYIDWRAKNPSDDLMTELLNAEYEDTDGERKNAHPRGGPQLHRPPRRRRQRDDDASHRLDGQGPRRASRPARAGRRGSRAGAEGDRGGAALRGAVAGAGPLRHARRRVATARPCPKAASW